MSLHNELLHIKEKYRNRIAFKAMPDVEWTYQDFYKDVCDRAWEFRTYAHKRVAVIAGASYEWLCYVYGALMVGKTVILVDALLPLDNMAVLLKNMDAEVVWTDAEDRKLRRMVEETCDLKMYVFNMQEQVEHECNDVEYEDGELIFFTSGTTSMAKGVVLPVEASYTNCKNLSEQLMANVEGTVYAPLPLYHIYSYTLVFAFLCQGRTICFGSSRRMAAELEVFKPEILVIVPAVAEYLMNTGIINENVKGITVAGTKCEKRLEQKAAEYNIFIQNLYGASETAGTIGLNLPGYGVDELVPAKGVEICWDKENGIVLRTVTRMKEYYKKPEETQAVLKGDYLVTGDIGQLNSNGTFIPLGRKSDVIAMKNGDKLYCDEMDQELSGLDGIIEACVSYIEEKIIVVGCIEEKNRSIAEVSIKSYNKKQPYFRKIDNVWLREEELPRTRIGKLKRKEVEKQYLQYKEIL